jgi:hypothetical protein
LTRGFAVPKFLFVVNVPPVPDELAMQGVQESPAWMRFVREAEPKIKLAKAVLVLQKNCWLLPADGQLPLLAELVALAKKERLSYSSLLIPDGEVVLALDVKP